MGWQQYNIPSEMAMSSTAISQILLGFFVDLYLLHTYAMDTT